MYFLVVYLLCGPCEDDDVSAGVHGDDAFVSWYGGECLCGELCGLYGVVIGVCAS